MTWDAVIIGGGPAGSAAAYMLSKAGRRVLVLEGVPGAQQNLAESLAPSCINLFRLLDFDERVLPRSGGNTVWWGKEGPRVESFADQGDGYLVRRAEFDKLLLDHARRAGAVVATAGLARQVEPSSVTYDSEGVRTTVRTEWVLDCSGRTGMVARRGYRVPDDRYRTLALCGVWRKEDGWTGINPTHTLIETYEEGWAWSVPLSPTERYVTCMVDGPRPYEAELGKLKVFRHLVDGAAAARSHWGCDASLYTSDRFAERGLLLVGDAGCTLDPLSSFGVKRAMTSGWLASLVVEAGGTPEALELFDDRSRRVFRDAQHQAAVYYQQAGYNTPFWSVRAKPPEDEPPLYEAEDLRRILGELRRPQRVRMERTSAAELRPRATLDGPKIVLRDSLLIPGVPKAVEYLQGVCLPDLWQMADTRESVPELFEAYNQTHTATGLPQFLAALSFLISKGALRPVPSGAQPLQ